MIRMKLALYPINSLVLFGRTHHNSDTMLTEFLVLVSRHFVLRIVDLVWRETAMSRSIVSETSRQFSSDYELVKQEYNFF